VLKRGALANLATASLDHLVQVIRHGLKKIQYRPGLLEGCSAGTGLILDQIEHPTGITSYRSLNFAASRWRPMRISQAARSALG
jgi:hypothetical protein